MIKWLDTNVYSWIWAISIWTYWHLLRAIILFMQPIISLYIWLDKQEMELEEKYL